MGKNSWPPGFRFHPTDEELILYYLKRKICRRNLKLDIIAEIDVCKYDAEELPGLSLLKNGDRQWFFFSPRDRKYQSGSRSNRSTRHGYWKATGKDRTITCNSRNVGMKKTLVFYRGRAPSGERTNYVMHEYILDEDELKRCKKVQDNYVLYKLFKKSGSGPKNGEQYGAPFKEEDWVDDDDHPEIPCNSDQANHAQELNNATIGNGDEQAYVSLDDIDEVIKRTIPEPVPLPVDLDEFERALCQFAGEEEPHTTVIHASFGETNYPESCSSYPLGREHYGIAQSFNISSSNSGLQLWDVSEVASTSNGIALSQHIADNDFLEEDDLFALEAIQGDPTSSHPSDNYLFENSQLTQDDGMSEFDLLYYPDFSVQDLLHGNQAVPSVSYQESQEGELVSQVISSATHIYPNCVSGNENEMWSFDLSSSLPTIAEPNQQPIPLQTTGAPYNGNSAIQYQNQNQTQNQNQNQNQNQTQNQNQNQAWVSSSSSLWSFVESIPAAPAFASESDMMNKAFQRMSSFSRLRMMNTKLINISSKSNGASVSPRKGVVASCSRIKGLFIFSFLLAILAVICMFFGSNAGVFGEAHCGMSL